MMTAVETLLLALGLLVAKAGYEGLWFNSKQAGSDDVVLGREHAKN